MHDAPEAPTHDRERLRLLLGAETLALLEDAGIAVDVRLDAPPEVEARALEELSKVRDRQRFLAQLASTGRTAAGVVHEVRNAMTGVLGLVQLARRRPAEDPEWLALLERECLRARELVSGFLELVRRGPATPRPVELGDVLSRASRLLEHQLAAHGVRLELALDAGAPAVQGVEHELLQVVLNLALNAQQALAGGGHVRVALRREGASAVVEVSDDGPGIPPEVAARIFDPFFSTKPPEKGTGLGLALCSEIVRTHGGVLEVASVPGEGATFTLRLPATAAPVSKAG